MHLNKDSLDKATGSPVEDIVKKVLPDIVSAPVFIAGVNRKLNTGNYESLDIFSAVSLPIPNADLSDIEALKELVTQTAATAFDIVAKETGDRFRTLKEMQKQGRSVVQDQQ